MYSTVLWWYLSTAGHVVSNTVHITEYMIHRLLEVNNNDNNNDNIIMIYMCLCVSLRNLCFVVQSVLYVYFSFVLENQPYISM